MKPVCYILFPAILLSFISQLQADEPLKKVTVHDAAQTIIATRNPFTKISPSHTGHPGYENVAFLYDKAVDALILNAAGHRKEARDILDYFADRLSIPIDELQDKVDHNGIYGIVKLIDRQGSTPLIALTNAIDISSRKEQGLSLLEFSTTPGPMAFLIFAFLNVDPHKYLDNARQLGDALIFMQDEQGGIRDGDRSPDRVYTEPHVDAYAAFLMLYQMTLEQRWKTAADKSKQWFIDHVYDPSTQSIAQGYWNERPNNIFALDCYSWTMAGPMGELMNLEDLQKMTRTMLRRGAVCIHLPLPDQKTKSLLLVDFTDPGDPQTVASRGGFHPMGSMEWTGGAILALQKNSVRFWKAGKKCLAIATKALAEIYLSEIKKGFYCVNGKNLTFYATGQGLNVAPFGGIDPLQGSNWQTPYFYSLNNQGKPLFIGGSLVGAWPFLPERRYNPFILNDPYGKIYNHIPCTHNMLVRAHIFLVHVGSGRIYREQTPRVLVNHQTQINEPRFYNKIIWKELQKGLVASQRGNSEEAKRSFLKALSWTKKVLDNPVWIDLAKNENRTKEKEFGGLIAYPWGSQPDQNNQIAELDSAIWRYPLLNEIGMTMWACAVIYAEMDDPKNSKYWIKRLLLEVPLHQIAATQETKPGHDEVIGYWNALVSWERNPGHTFLDDKMKVLFQTAVREMTLNNHKTHFSPLSVSRVKPISKN